MPTAAELSAEAQTIYNEFTAADGAYFEALKAEYGDERAADIAIGKTEPPNPLPEPIRQLRGKRDELNQRWDIKAHEAYVAEKRERG